MKSANEDLAGLCRTTAEAASAAVAWLNENPAQVRQEQPSLLREFRKFAQAANKLAAAAERLMCVGVFGASQSGKSYLISAFGRPGGSRPLIADFDGIPDGIDFLRHINPEGGRESTGVVTRFSMRRKATSRGFPIPVRLLSQADIVKIIGNTTFSDCDLSDETVPDAAEIAKLTEQARASVQAVRSAGLTEDDIWDIQDYFERQFKGQPIIRALSSAGYWSVLAELAPRIDTVSRAALFAPLWSRIDQFTALYIKLTLALDQLGHASEAFCPIEALVSPAADGFRRRSDSVISVLTLNGLVDVSDSTVEIRGSSGATAALPRPIVTALIAELHVTMHQRPWDFLEQTDLLDFPGARSREIINPRSQIPMSNVRQKSGNDKLGVLETLFLRGKVAYLFERYNAEQELTSMLLCVGPGPQEVQTLPAMVKDWIDKTHGPDPGTRAENALALFFILTKFDDQFVEAMGQDQVSTARWDRRIEVALISFFGLQKWPQEWTPGKAFDNCFWMRNPTISAKHIMDYDDDRVEVAIRPSEVRRIARMREEYLASELVNRHIRHPAEAWDEAFRLNDGGVSYLARSIAPVCNPMIKNRQISIRLDLLRKTMRERLERYHVSDDLAEQRKMRHAAAQHVVGCLLSCVRAQRFGGLMRHLQVSDVELGDVFLNDATQAKIPRHVVIDVQEWEVMFDVKAGGDEVKILDAADAYANAAVEHWIETIRSLANNPRVCTHFKMADKAMSDLVDELIAGAARLDLRKRIATQIRPAVGAHRHVRDSVGQLSLYAANIIGAFVFWLGYDTLPGEARPARRDNAAMRIFQPATTGDVLDLGEEPARFDGRFYADWFTAYFDFVKLNSESVAGRQIDVVQNDRIGKILSGIGRAVQATPVS